MSLLAPREPFTHAIAVNVKSVQGVLSDLLWLWVKTVLFSMVKSLLSLGSPTAVRVSLRIFAQSTETPSMASLRGFHILSQSNPGH